MADHDDELVDAVRELAQTIDALRDELDDSRSRRRTSLRPPTPRELLRFSDEVALPAILAVLETSVRALEAFQRSLKLVRGEREARDRTAAAAEATSERTSELRRTTLSQLDAVLAELQRAVSEGGLPADEQARDLLTEARTLRDDVDRRLRDAAERETRTTDQSQTTADRGIEIDIEDGTPADTETDADGDRPGDDRDSAVDVDAELETLRDRYGSDEGAQGDSNGDDDRDGADPDPTSDGNGGTHSADDEPDTSEKDGDEPDR
ncbi:DUF7547 family protein [Natrinema gelatinilyticum]|uniref:DUF7547 family protein n=1 Tax=Natrinema gelatinilyticum TaxID=2961571 RepID=UPI0020C272DB|nr:hypothetical protein [Natrinema gelatinilyticum]